MDLKVEPWDLDSSVEVLHLRLTDACLNALEQEHNSGLNLDIQALSSTSGVMRIRNASNNFSKDFMFSYSDENQIKGPPLQIMRLKPKQGSAENLGGLTKRLTVTANDEVYESCTKKMTAIEESSKQKSAKELKSCSSSQNALKANKIKRLQNSAPTSSIPMLKKIKDSYKSNKLNSTLKPASTTSQTSSINVSKTRPIAKVDYASIPILKRIIQVIAIRPYKRSDLIARFTLEGIDVNDKAKIDPILQKVTYSIDKSKDQKYLLLSLKPEYLKSVDPNWDHYTPPEKQLVARNLEKMNSNESQKMQNVLKENNSDVNQEKQKNPRPNVNTAPIKTISNSSSLSPSKKHNESNSTKNCDKSPLTFSNDVNDKSGKIENRHSTTSKPNLSSITKKDYNKYVAEYNELYPVYEKLYKHIMRIKDQYQSYHQQVTDLSKHPSDFSDTKQFTEEELNEKLLNLKHTIETQNECLGTKFAEDLEKEKKMHNRILFLKGAIKSFVHSSPKFAE